MFSPARVVVDQPEIVGRRPAAQAAMGLTVADCNNSAGICPFDGTAASPWPAATGQQNDEPLRTRRCEGADGTVAIVRGQGDMRSFAPFPTATAGRCMPSWKAPEPYSCRAPCASRFTRPSSPLSQPRRSAGLATHQPVEKRRHPILNLGRHLDCTTPFAGGFTWPFVGRVQAHLAAQAADR